MLILSRKACEAIVITVPPSDVPQQIRIVVTSFRTSEDGRKIHKCKLGFVAAKDVAIVREELLAERKDP